MTYRYTCHHSHRLDEPAAKGRVWGGLPRLAHSTLQSSAAETCVDLLLWPCRSQLKGTSRQTPASTEVVVFVGCLTSQQHASVSQGRICLGNFTCCHTEIEVADQIFHLTQSQYTDTEPTSPSTDPIAPRTWQGSHWSANIS